jgi:tetratricopeptide (TPR) repeat protein
METKFFREGDELSQLSTGPDAGDGWAEATASVQWRRRRGGVFSWAAVGMAAVLVSSVLAFRLAGRQPLPSPSQAIAAEPARPIAEALAPPPQPAAGASISQPGATSGQADRSALVACQTAFARHRARDVLAKCRRAFALHPASAEIAVMLAKTEFDRGHYRPAFDWARQALALDDEQADAYVFLGGAEQAAGHRAAARSAYQRYLQLSPKGRYAGDVRAVLGSL